jgi:predicted nucleic acid-binding protein
MDATTSMATPAEVAVLDASIVVDVLVRGVARLPQAFEFVAPAHLDAEVLSALARLSRAGTLSSAALEDMLDGLAELPLQRMPLPALLAGAFRLRGNISVRDSLYVALAHQLDATLLTLDRRLASVCRHTGVCKIL